jgi:hypothetical protein
MKILFERLWQVLPVPVLAVERMPGRLIGLSMGVFVIIRSDFAADRPTVIHELEHCKQFWRGGAIIHMARYYLSRAYRLKVEVEAFRAEIAACEPHNAAARLDEAARALSSGYRIERDVEACMALLTGRTIRVAEQATQSAIDEGAVSERWASPAAYSLMAARPKALIAPVAARAKPI